MPAQLRVVTGQRGGVLRGHHNRRVGAPQKVVLGVLDDGIDGQSLRRGGGGQVVIAFDVRTVVRIDGPAAAPGPRSLIVGDWSARSTARLRASGPGAAVEDVLLQQREEALHGCVVAGLSG